MIVLQHKAPRVKVTVHKPHALCNGVPSVTMECTRASFSAEPASLTAPSLSEPIKGGTTRAVLALGSNLGDRLHHMHHALQLLEETPGLVVLRTSRMYQSAPAYYTEQDNFLNAVCSVSVHLPEDCVCGPTWLLAVCKQVEATLGRNAGPRNGPRPMDVDILYYYTVPEDESTEQHVLMDTDLLCVPHRSIAERSFVLQPLLDLAPSMKHPILQQSTTEMVARLVQGSDGAVDVCPVLAFPNTRPECPMMQAEVQTLLMAVLNVTPDSFSDGGADSSPDESVLRALAMMQKGAQIVDVGGQSTRPGAEAVSLQEELARVVPVVQSLRKLSPEAFISVDTSSEAVACQSIAAGANMINDVTAGKSEPGILAVAAAANVPMVLMHSRGTPKTMSSPPMKQYEDVLAEVVSELKESAELALKAGVRSWNLVLDPGIGFAKGLEENLELMRRLPELKAALHPYPVLVGTSRKSFIGTITKVERPEGRLMGTAATCVMAVAAGVDMLRIHDVAEIHQTVLMADAVYRTR
eukprot:TRINITY_DN21739_c0_g1_i1.p1 TRINITY_DN21739_c0_g1~~TRINITY_DN21739_c0_g1_i1.p1  ORF type:complete len:524 (-),score=144.77 TRINITY_DN21739_c0_g1_i1:222-1793(-)